MADYQQWITSEPTIRNGQACVRGLRIAVTDVLGWLAEGMSIETIIEDFPMLNRQDIEACMRYAADQEGQRAMLSAD